MPILWRKRRYLKSRRSPVFQNVRLCYEKLYAKGGAEDAEINCGVIMINMKTAEYRIFPVRT